MMSTCRRLKLLALAAVCVHGVALGDYDVRVELKNVSGEAKRDWPVILRVYTVLGRNLDPTTVRRDGFHVYDASGAEMPHAIEQLPPYDRPGNDELIFVIPRIKAGETLTYRVTNTAKRSAKRSKIDVVASPHNLIADGGFESGAAGRPAHFSAPGVLDTKVAHSGKRSLLLTADNKTVVVKYGKPVKLHKDSWYYCNGKSQRRDATGQSGRSLGQEVDLIAKWDVSKTLELLAGYSWFQPGGFVDRTGRHGDADWWFLQLLYRF